MKSLRGVTALPLLAALVLSCTDGPVEPGPDPNPGPSNGGAQPVADPSFATIVQPIFQNNSCTASNCHGVSQSGGLDLRSGSSYTALVNEPAQGESGKIRVIPGDADGSYLVIKLEGRQSFGSSMPVGGALSQTDLTNIKNWINQGAKNN